MKLTINKLALILLSALQLMFISCEKDNEDLLLNQSEKGNYQLKEYSFKQASRIVKFKRSYDFVTGKLNKSKSVNKSNAPEVDNDFAIDSTTIKEIKFGSVTTYTMLIKRPNPTNDSFENLIVQVDDRDSTRAFIAKYYPSAEMEYIQAHDSYTFHGDSEMKEIKYDSNVFMPLVDDGECSIKLMCNWGGSEHAAGDNCTQTYLVVDCAGGGGSGSGGPTGGTGDGSTGGTSGGSTSGGSGSGGVGSTSNTDTTTDTTTNGDPVGVPTSIVSPPYKNLNVTTVLSLNTEQANWINNINRVQTKKSLQEFLYYNNNAQSKEYALQLINLAMENNSSFSFDSSLNSTNSLNFNSVDEFKDYLNAQQGVGSSPVITYEDLQTGEKIANATIEILGPFDMNITIKQMLNPFEVKSVKSNFVGVTFAQGWDQTDYSVNIRNEIATIDIYGTHSVFVFIQGIGTVYSQNESYRVKVNTVSGSIIAAFKY